MQIFGKPLELLILDVDGVLLEVISFLRRDLETVARAHGLTVEPIRQYLAAVAAGERRGHASFAEGLREFWPQLTAEESLRLAQMFQEERRRNPWPPVDGSIEAIRWFARRGLPIVLCTSNDLPTLKNQLDAAWIDRDQFTAFGTWESPYRKPDPRALDQFFDIVPIPRGHALYVGDWYPDLETARGAGVRFVAVLSGGIPKHAFTREGVAEDHIIERLADLPRLVTE